MTSTKFVPFELERWQSTWENRVRFNISDPQNTGYRFPDSPDQAMWVKTIDAIGPDNCPTTSMHWDGFEATSVINNNMTLLVDNPNPAEQLFAFTLRFSKTPHDVNPDCVPFDPIGTNKNGPSLNNSAVLLTVLVVVGVAAFAAYKLLLN